MVAKYQQVIFFTEEVNQVKVSKTPAQLVELLGTRGMQFNDKAHASHFLSNVNYYKLKAYLRFFEEPCPYNDHKFDGSTTFEDVLRLYRFDRKLRLLLCDMLERLEIAVRTRWALELSQFTSNPQAHEDMRNFSNKYQHSRALSLLKDQYESSREAFAIHHRTHYQNQQTPPIWVSVELLSFGAVSKWVANTKFKHLRSTIATHFGLNEEFFTSWIKQAVIVRNFCSHHCRLWNKAIPFRPSHPKASVKQLTDDIGLELDASGDIDKIYNFLITLSFVAARISPGHSWNDRLTTFLKKDTSRLEFMGFPDDWESRFARHLV